MLALIAYTYVGYPALVYLLSRLFEKPVRRADITPKVSIIIAAYNEERDIAQKIENTLALEYPKAKLEIIVASDCSSDSTDRIVASYAQEGVILHRRLERLGKSVAQNAAMKCSTGEIIVFSDATTHYNPNAIQKIVRSFADPEVGCVAGHLLYVDRSTTAVGQGCRSYWGYERFIKQCESKLGSLIGVSGCLYAVRRSSYARLALDMSSDFVIATEIYLQGLRTIYDCEAISTEDTNKRSQDEFRMRVRVIEQTLSALQRYQKVFNLRAHPLFGFQMISHKVLRYGVPVFLIAAFLSNMMLMGYSEIYNLAFIGQITFYLAVITGWICDWLKLRTGPLGFPYYFALANAASLVAFIKFIRGEAHVIWEPIRETDSTKGYQAKDAKPHCAIE